MPQALQEFFHGGLVTARHPALLVPGELQKASETVYRDRDPAIWQAPSRAQYNATVLGSPSAIKGLSHLIFDQDTDLLVAYVGTVIYSSQLTTITGTFSSLITGLSDAAGSPETLDIAQFGTAYYLFPSSDAPRKVAYRHPVQLVDTATTISGGNTLTTTTVDGFKNVQLGQFVSATGGTGSIGAGATVAAKLSNVSVTISGTNTNGTPTSVTFASTSFPYTQLVGLQPISSFSATGNNTNVLVNADANTTVQSDKRTLVTTTANGFQNVQVGNHVTGSGGTGTIGAGAIVSGLVNTTTIVVSVDGTAGTIGALTIKNSIGGPARVSGTWPAKVAGSWGVGYYFFLYTEMVIPTFVDDYVNGFIEGSFVSNPAISPLPPPPIQYIQITDVTTQAIQVFRGNIVNTVENGLNRATHWQVYISPEQDDPTTPPSLATFFRLGSPIPIGTDNFTFTNGSLTQGPKNPTAYQAFGTRALPTNPTGMFVPYDNNVGYFTSTSQAITLKTFGLVSSGAYNGATVAGIVVNVYMGNNSAVGVVLRTPNKSSDIYQVTPNGRYKATLGGATDPWNFAPSPSDFVDGTLLVDVFPAYAINSGQIQVEGLEVIVYYNGSTFSVNGVPFRVVTYKSQVGTTVSDPANLPPPIASTGDVFQGQMVVNDNTNTNQLRYSLPGVPESFPKPYVLKFNSRKKAVVTNVKTLGQVLVVGLRGSIKRINYLPTELDVDFGQGVADEDITTDHGIAGPLSATKFDMPGAGITMIYASSAGVFLTNGFTTRPVNQDLDWPNTVKLSALVTSVFRVYPREKWLVLYYCPAGASHNKNTAALVYSYADDKLKDTISASQASRYQLRTYLPVTGPNTVSARSSCEVNINGTDYLFTGHESDGHIYVEDQGNLFPTTYKVADLNNTNQTVLGCLAVRTRRMYAAGIGRDVRSKKQFMLHDQQGVQSSLIRGNLVAGSNVINGTIGAFTGVLAGETVYSPGKIPPGTIVLNVAGNGSSMNISANALKTLNSVAMYFDTGTLAITLFGAGIDDEGVLQFDTGYLSTFQGDLSEVQTDNSRQGLEVLIEKVHVWDQSQNPAVDLGLVALNAPARLHSWTTILYDEGAEENRAT